MNEKSKKVKEAKINKKSHFALHTSQNSGITLVALIITIIVLLILAVVAIRAVSNDGIISHAKNAREEYEQAQTNEQTQLQNYLNVLNENNPKGSGAGNVAYTIGQEVMVGTERFYVIKDSDATQDKVTLLAKDCIDTTNLLQSSSAGNVKFSTESYWGEGTSPYDIVEPDTIPATHIAAKAAYDYGVEVGGTGRLMTYREAEALQSENSDILYGENGKSSSSYLNYWLGSAYDTGFVWHVNGDGSSLYGNYGYGIGSLCGVRPVVEILKSKVSIAP